MVLFRTSQGYYRGTKLEGDSLLMITIFQQVHNGDGISDPMKYLERYALDIKEAGQLFAYLDLAEYDRISPLGFKPTPRFIAFLAEPENHSSKPDKNMRFRFHSPLAGKCRIRRTRRS